MLSLFLVFILQSIAFFVLLERHMLGLSHNRYGPKKSRFYGMLQPILDGVKLINKEQVILFNCTSRVFLLVVALNFIRVYLEFLLLYYRFRFIVLS